MAQKKKGARRVGVGRVRQVPPADTPPAEPSGATDEQSAQQIAEETLREAARAAEGAVDAAEDEVTPEMQDLLEQMQSLADEVHELAEQSAWRAEIHIPEGFRRRGIKQEDLDRITAELAAPFPAENIEWRIGRAGVKQSDGSVWAKALAYIDNRGVMNRLDTVVGPANWREEYRAIGPSGDITSGGFLCGISLLIEGEWVTKWDGADWPDTEPFKGAASNAEKRAAVKWGIGRYLYNLPESFVHILDKTDRYEAGVRYQPASRKPGKEVPEFYWREPALPSWALPGGSGSPTGGPEGNGPGGGARPARSAPPPSSGAPSPTTGQPAPTPGETTPGGSPPSPPVSSSPTGTAPPRTEAPNGEHGRKIGPYAPTEKQVAFYQKLCDSPVFTEEERRRALEWLATKATRQTIKDQIDWLRKRVEQGQSRQLPADQPAGAASTAPAASAMPTPPLAQNAPPPDIPPERAPTAPPPSPQAPAAALPAQPVPEGDVDLPWIKAMQQRATAAPEDKARHLLAMLRTPGFNRKEASEWYTWVVQKATPENIEAAIGTVSGRVAKLKPA